MNAAGYLWKELDKGLELAYFKVPLKIYSIAAVATDKSGNVLFIHSRAPFSVYDFNRMLLTLPLDIQNAMYVEGGPEATLYVNAGGERTQRVGSYETRFIENDGNDVAWEIPNIIGIRRRH